MGVFFKIGLWPAAVMILAVSTVGAAAQSISNGKDVFEDECAVCHATEANINGKGPSLFAVAGTRAATATKFKYSAALINSGVIWTDDQLDLYVKNAKAMIPGSTMGGKLDDAKARADVVAYIKTLH